MTTFTINAGGTVKWDSLSGGSTNATLDVYNISNKTTLLIETDSMYCAGHSVAAGSADSFYPAGTGGKLKLDGTNVRVIPYNTGTGNVPAIGTTISQGANTGYLLGVWANWQSEPTAAGAAMPASGYIKIKDKSGNFASGAITSIGASATGADVVGWIEVRGPDTGEILESRLFSFESVADWFYLDNTNGSRGQVIPCPTTGTNAGCWSGGVQIETGVGTGVYEWYRHLGSMAADSTIPTDAIRGKVCWQTTSGIRIGSDGTNNVGYLPASGCRVRIGNVIMTCCTRSGSGSGARVVPNATFSTRMEHRPSAAGVINLSKSHSQWYVNCGSNYSSSIHDCGISDTLVFNTQQLALDCVGNCVATTQSQTGATECYTLTNCFAGGVFTDNVGFRQNNSTVFNLANVSDVTFARNHGTLATDGGNVWNCLYGSISTWTDETVVGARMYFLPSKDIKITNLAFVQHYRGTTTGSVTNSGAVDCEDGCSDILIDGITLPVTNNHPRSWLVGFARSRNCTLRNAGTYAAYLTAGSVNPTLVLVGRKFSFQDYATKIQRCFMNGLTGISGHDTNNYGLVLENVFGDFADTYASLSPNSVAKGCGFAVYTTALNSVFGVHFRDHYTSTTVGKLHLAMNEPTTLTTAQFSITAGTVLFDGSGHVIMTTVGDQAIWEMPYFATGHTAFANVAPTIVDAASNYTYEFQYDIGAGYNGTWLTINATNLNGVGAINPATGVRIKVRITCTTAHPANTISSILIETVTTSTAQSTNFYPLDINTLTFTGLQTGTDVVIYDAGTTTVLGSVDAVSGTTWGYVYSGADTIDVGVFKAGYVPLYIRGLAIGTTDRSIPIAQTIDRGYLV